MGDLEAITRSEKLMNGQYVEPITRREKILAGEELEPVTREEYFLKKYRGGGSPEIDVVQLSVTENGDYTAPSGKAYSPVRVAVPEATLIQKNITANGNYNASSDNADGFSSVSVNVPLPENAYLLKEIEDVAIASFNDGADLPMPKLEVAIEPQQEGSGAPSPTNIRPISGWDEVNVSVCGKNVWNNIPFLENKYISDNNGTISNSNNYNIYKIKNNKNISYKTLSFDFDSSITNQALRVSLYDVNGVVSTFGQIIDINERNICVINADSSIDYFLVSVRKEASNIQLENGNQPTTYEPYNGHTYTIELGSTRYGGTLDVVNGVLMVDRMDVDMGDLNYILGGGGLVFYSSIPSRKTGTIQIISDSYKYIGNASDSTVRDGDDGVIATEANSEQIKIKDTRFDSASAIKQAMASHKIIFPLATPITIQLTPTMVKSLLGANNVWADTGNILEASYFAKEASA